MKTKINAAGLSAGLGLTMLALVVGATGCESGATPAAKRTDFKPTVQGDEHEVPVYTSPTTAPDKDLSKP
jgi:hypothetical protein